MRNLFTERIQILVALALLLGHLSVECSYASGSYPDLPEVSDHTESCSGFGAYIEIGSWYNTSRASATKRAREVCEEVKVDCLAEAEQYKNSYSEKCLAAGGIARCHLIELGVGCDKVKCKQGTNSFPTEAWLCPPSSDPTKYYGCEMECECEPTGMDHTSSSAQRVFEIPVSLE